MSVIVNIMIMMFNGLVMCTTDSDSDFAKESVGRSSAAESPSSSCASARAHYYQNKLLATLQILQNKEETVRVQADSLAVAEARIAALNARGSELKREIERKGRELQALRIALEDTRLEKTDVSITAQIEEMEDQENIVKTLQNNLTVIEELYRECFYETVKQEDLIEMLRKSYLDVRLMDKKKTDQISKLHNVINTQKWSLDRCQDIATEVDNLKVEISNFLNSSSNDSGMWEESIAGELNEDLQDIATQLLRLRELLTGDCTCGLEEENIRLKQANNESMIEVEELRQRISQLETDLESKDIIDRKYQDEIDSREKELNIIREQLLSMEQENQEQNTNCDDLSKQLNQTEVLLSDKSTELLKIQKHCEMYQETIARMSQQLDKLEEITKENISLRKEKSDAIREMTRLQRLAQTLEAELSHVRGHFELVDAKYREKKSSVQELETALEVAQSRGAQLCEETRRVVRSVSCWATDMRDKHRELVAQMKQKDVELRQLQQKIQGQKDLSRRPSDCCSLLPSSSTTSRVEESQRYDQTSEGACFCMRKESVGERRGSGVGTSASEIASCSSTPAPVPPKRTLRKKMSCEDRIHLQPSIISADEATLSRLQSASAALARSCRRWTRARAKLT